MSPSLRLAAGAAIALALVLGAGCADDRRPPPKAVRMPGLRWDQFPDIPFPPGWRPIPDEDRIAIAIGGGSVRRLLLALQAPAARTDLEPDTAISRFVAGALPAYGWVRSGEGRPTDLTQVWTRGGETLEVRAEREDSLAVLRYRLR